VWTRCFKV